MSEVSLSRDEEIKNKRKTIEYEINEINEIAKDNEINSQENTATKKLPSPKTLNLQK